MKLHCLQHVPFERSGSIEPWAKARGVKFTTTHLYKGETPSIPDEIDALLVVGGPMGVGDVDAHPWLRAEKEYLRSIIDSELKILGICLGAQLLAESLGASVAPNAKKEIGWYPITYATVSKSLPELDTLSSITDVFHWHGDTFDIPEGAVPVASSERCANQGFLYQGRILALQFHPEFTVESVETLNAHCPDELMHPDVEQSLEEMIATPTRFDRMNARFNSCLDTFFLE